jgi:hypothetical protein
MVSVIRARLDSIQVSPTRFKISESSTSLCQSWSSPFSSSPTVEGCTSRSPEAIDGASYARQCSFFPGKEKELLVHHKLEKLLDASMNTSRRPASASRRDRLSSRPLSERPETLSRRPLVRTSAADMLKRRLKQAALPAHYSPHSFRATSITEFSGKRWHP